MLKQPFLNYFYKWKNILIEFLLALNFFYIPDVHHQSVPTLINFAYPHLNPGFPLLCNFLKPTEYHQVVPRLPSSKVCPLLRDNLSPRKSLCPAPFWTEQPPFAQTFKSGLVSSNIFWFLSFFIFSSNLIIIKIMVNHWIKYRRTDGNWPKFKETGTWGNRDPNWKMGRVPFHFLTVSQTYHMLKMFANS